MSYGMIFSTAVPQGWTANIVRDKILPRSEVFPSWLVPQETNLVGLLEKPKEWKVRHQHRRGTCNAFAGAAATELSRMLEGLDEEPSDLSEEYLYAMTRDVRYDVVPAVVSSSKQTEFERTGGTFLAQVSEALSQRGIALEKDVPYEPNAAVNYTKEEIAAHVITDAQNRKPDRSLMHDMTDATMGADRLWIRLNKEIDLLLLFAYQLSQKNPVMASFAIPADCEHVWGGALAHGTGRVRYPPLSAIGDRPAVAAHTVCLTGYVPPSDPNDGTDGWFLFRNSYGTELFGRYADDFPDNPNAGFPGYGFISATDVNLYCWEFLTLSAEEKIEFFQPGANTPVI